MLEDNVTVLHAFVRCQGITEQLVSCVGQKRLLAKFIVYCPATLFRPKGLGKFYLLSSYIERSMMDPFEKTKDRHVPLWLDRSSAFSSFTRKRSRVKAEKCCILASLLKGERMLQEWLM